MDTCVFCKIRAGELPASWIHRDDVVMAFMDIQPVNEGHTLLLPAAHAPNIANLDDGTTAHLFAIARRITRVLYETLKCDGVNWLVADGEAAGQEVFHFHLHLIPRYHQDGFGFRFPNDYRELPTRQALDHIARPIRGAAERQPSNACHAPDSHW